MTFANEMNDFIKAFGATSEILGTRSSREKDRLDNEYRRAQIDYTKALTAEKNYSPFDDFTYNPGGGGAPGTDVAAPADTGDTGVAAPGTTSTVVSGGAPTSPNRSPGSFLTTAASGAYTTNLKPRPRPATHTTPTVSPAVDDGDVATAKAEAVSSADPGALAAAGMTNTGGRPRQAFGSVQERIKDRTGGISSLQPAAQRVLSAMDTRAQQLGVQLVLTAGAGPGHLSHGSGVDFDIVGYQNGKLWNSQAMTQVLAAGGAVGANRFGMYPGGSAHVGIAGSGRPSAMWGAGGLVRGEASRQYTDPYQRALYDAFRNGKLYGSGGQASFEAVQGNQSYGDPRQRVRNAIAWIESRGDGDYSAINKSSGALGRYQVMPRFLPEFSQEALGRVVSPQEFLANPELQDQIFDSHFGKLFEKYGNLSDAASAWYTGGSLAEHPEAQRYVTQFNQQLGAGGGMPAAAGSTGTPGVPGVTGAVPEYPESRTKDDWVPEYPDSRNKDDVAALDPKIHTIAKGDTLWDLAQENNLDSYMRIVEANPGIVENPDLIYPGEQFVIPPGSAGAVNAEASPPNPTLRPAAEVAGIPDPNLRPSQHPTSSTGDTLDIGPNVRPAGGPGALPPDSYTPTGEEPQAELQRAMDRRAQIAADTTLNPALKNALVQALDVKIQQLSGVVGGTGSSTPTDTTHPVAQRPGLATAAEKATRLNQATINEGSRARTERRRLDVYRSGVGNSDPTVAPMSYTPPADGADAEVDIPLPNTRPAIADVPRPPARPERGPVNPEDVTGVEAEEVEGGGGTGVQQGSAGRDMLGPAQQSIAAVSDFAGQGWNISEDGHVTRPDGRKAPDDTYKSGKHAVRNGMDWLMETFFPGVNGGGVGDDVDDPDDPSDDVNAEAYLSGKGAAKKSDMMKVRGAVLKWAKDQGITLSEEELTMRSLGAMSDFWTMQGEPQKARAVAGSMLQYKRRLGNQFSAIAKAALQHGDLDKAAEAAVEAYAHIPDGRDIQVTGDATTGYTVTYTNAETGKRIAKKVMSPQEMTGMIMNMSPDDVDKFLVKAAGEEDIPDASPQLEKLLSDLEDTPPGTRPVWDARGAAGLDANEQTILHNAHIQALAIWTEQTGGVEGQKEAADVERIFGPNGATPTAPETSAATATAPAAPGVTSAEPSGAVGDDTLAGGDTTAAPAATGEVAPGIYPPGDDMTFGLGEPPRRDLPLYAQLETTKGLTIAGEKFKQDTEDYERELKMRQTKYNAWRLNPTSPAEVKPGAVDAGAPDVTGGWLGDEGPLVRAQQQYPYLNQAIMPMLPPGPNDGAGGFGLPAKSDLEADPAEKLGQSPENVTYIEDREKQRLAKWDEEHAKRAAAYNDQLKAITPISREIGEEEAADITNVVTTFLATPELTEEEKTQLEEHRYVIEDGVRAVAEANGLSTPSATKKLGEMVLVNPDNPSLPDWRSFPHPTNPGIILVQPIDLDGNANGAILHIPKTVFDPISQAWRAGADKVIGVNDVRYDKMKSEQDAARTAELDSSGREMVSNIKGAVGDAATDALDFFNTLMGGEAASGEPAPPPPTRVLTPQQEQFQRRREELGLPPLDPTGPGILPPLEPNPGGQPPVGPLWGH